MKTYVVGAGAVGSFLGSALERQGNEVVYAPRNHADVQPIQADLAIVAVKAYDTQAAIETLRRAVGEGGGTTIFTPQNGVGNEEQLAQVFGADNVMSGALTIPIDITRNGEKIAASEGGLGIAPVGTSAHNWLVAAFEGAGIPVIVHSDYRALKWSKLMLNIVANATCAILNVLPERLVHYDEIFGFEIKALRETRAVMQAMGLKAVDLPRYPVRALQAVATLPIPAARMILANRVAGARGRKAPSLLIDLRAAKGQTEVGVLNGAVVEAGREHGVPTPVNAAITRVLSDIAHMPQLWAKYREQPDALEAEVRDEIARTSAAKLARR
jgi:2-dehydropantoate 2-reductase